MSSASQLELGESFGVMQGRLSPQSPRGYQTFPSETWEGEFNLAKRIGFQHIEWVLELFELGRNPFFVEPEKLVAASKETGVKVISVCADFLMQSPLGPHTAESWSFFERMLEASALYGVQVVVIPCVDNASLSRPENLANLLGALPRMISSAENHDLLLALETDLAPLEFSLLLERFNHPNLTVNYDSGNSASLGFDFAEEMMLYGDKVSCFHLKDRLRGGPSVNLGEGSTDLRAVVEFLRNKTFKGVVTMQAARDFAGPPSVLRQLDILFKETGVSRDPSE